MRTVSVLISISGVSPQQKMSDICKISGYHKILAASCFSTLTITDCHSGPDHKNQKSVSNQIIVIIEYDAFTSLSEMRQRKEDLYVSVYYQKCSFVHGGIISCYFHIIQSCLVGQGNI